MTRKTLISTIVGCAFFAFAGTAAATTYTVNMCGASAQAGFWQQAGEAVVQDTFDCIGGAVLDGIDDKHMIVRGLQCTVDGTGTNDDTIFVRYNVENSEFGCQNYDCVNSGGWAAGDNEGGDCDFDGTPFDCTVAVNANCQLGCADVPCDTITATTYGYASGRKGAPSQGGTDPFTQHGDSAGFSTPNATDFYLGVTVPFGFIVNNSITDYVCVEPDQDDLPAGAELAYCKENWECDPRLNHDGTQNPQCAGDYKCIDAYGVSGIGVCLDGTQDPVALDADITAVGTDPAWTGKGCVTPADCKLPQTMTSCEPRPIKNVSRLMALHIFSDAVDNWQDFGPSFPNLAIVKCMRHGGSGTHQTLINTVFRGDAQIATFTNEYPTAQPGNAGASYVWHYKSSSDLTRDCVARYAGAIGYVDADKVMYTNKIVPTSEPAAYTEKQMGISQVMYQGVAPSRLAVAMGKYNFWAQQRCFLNNSCMTATEYAILDAVMTGAADPAKLSFAGFGQRAFLWATQGEMRTEKVNEFAYPSRVAPDPGFPPIDPGPFPF